jgi:hypothetical protein
MSKITGDKKKKKQRRERVSLLDPTCYPTYSFLPNVISMVIAGYSYRKFGVVKRSGDGIETPA